MRCVTGSRLLVVRGAGNFGASTKPRPAFPHRMPYIQLNDKQFPLRVGETSVGTAGADIPVDGPAALGVQAKLQLGNDNSVVIRRASSEAAVRVNGVLLGVEPTPLIHGDKIEVAGRELLYGDDRKGGQTQYLAGLNVAELTEARPAGAGKPTAATGGRLVSLVDGREYSVGANGLSIGRDAGCDVVVPSPEVSRKHAEVLAGSEGYTVNDLSTNGVFVNGQRIATKQSLARGDVLRIGTEEFRFYADAAAAQAVPPAVPPQPPAAQPAAQPAAAPTPAPQPPAPAPVAAQPAPAAPAPSAATREPLATVEIMNDGPMKGTRFEIDVPLTHVGRGAHNDIVLADDSVSDSHAKIQKREAGWYVVDMGSTNGTYVGGQRISGEAALKGQSSIRFGKIRATFLPAAEPRDASGGTRVIAGLSVEQARKMSREVAATEPELPKKSGLPAWVWILVLVLVVAGAFFILKVR